jgi:hypothetical protein
VEKHAEGNLRRNAFHSVFAKRETLRGRFLPTMDATSPVGRGAPPNRRAATLAGFMEEAAEGGSYWHDMTV